MNNLIESEAHCVNNEAFYGELNFTAEVSEALAKRILELSEAAKALGVYQVKEFDNNGQFFEGCELLRVECMMLQVTDSSFKWSAIPKHCGADLTLESELFPLGALA